MYYTYQLLRSSFKQRASSLWDYNITLKTLYDKGQVLK